jgi:hypothetical protein
MSTALTSLTLWFNLLHGRKMLWPVEIFLSIHALFIVSV